MPAIMNINEELFKKLLINNLDIGHKIVLVLAEENLRIEDMTLKQNGGKNPFANLSTISSRIVTYYGRVENATIVLRNYNKIIELSVEDLHEVNFEKGGIYFVNLTSTKDIRKRIFMFAEHADIIKTILNEIQKDSIILYTGYNLYETETKIKTYRNAENIPSSPAYNRISLINLKHQDGEISTQNPEERNNFSIVRPNIINQEIERSKREKGYDNRQMGETVAPIDDVNETTEMITETVTEGEITTEVTKTQTYSKTKKVTIQHVVVNTKIKEIFINNSDIFIYASSITLNFAGRIYEFTNLCSSPESRERVLFQKRKLVSGKKKPKLKKQVCRTYNGTKRFRQISKHSRVRETLNTTKISFCTTGAPLKLTFTFKEFGGYWILKTLKLWENTTNYKFAIPYQIYAPFGFSYHCANATYVAVDGKTRLSIVSFQITPQLQPITTRSNHL